jgi:hypothetical protein
MKKLKSWDQVNEVFNSFVAANKDKQFVRSVSPQNTQAKVGKEKGKKFSLLFAHRFPVMRKSFPVIFHNEFR